MSLGLTLNEGVTDSERKLNILVTAVKHYGNDSSVGILKGNGLDLGSPLAAADSLRTALYVLAEVTYVVVGIVNIYIACLCVNHNRRIAEIANVIGATLFVEKQIPIAEGGAEILKVSDNIVSILFADLHGVHLAETVFVAALGEDDILCGIKLVEDTEVFKVVASVPVASYTVDIF